jgi:ankyrin repeat protein
MKTKHLLLTTIAAVVLVGCGTTVQERDTVTISIHNFDAQMRGGKSEGRKRNATADYQLSKRLINACKKGDLKAAKIVISNGARVDLRDSERNSPLHHAVSGRNANLVKYLISLEADVKAKTIRGVTPLHLAAKNGDKEIVELLIKKDANVNARVWLPKPKELLRNPLFPEYNYFLGESESGESPLHYAAENGDKDIVELLIKKGADINYLTREGVSPLDSASVSENNDVFALLRDRGGKTARQIIFKRKIVQSVFARVSNLLKEQPIHSSLFEDIKKRLYALDDVKHPIYFYISVNDFHNVRQILSNQSDQTKKPVGADGISPLLVASLIGNREIGEILISNGADLSEIFHEDYTVLHIATLLEDKDYCELLIFNGANINTKTKTGKTALDFVAQNGNAEINNLLRRNAGKTAEQLETNNK